MSLPLALLYYSNLMPGGQLGNWLQDLGYRVQTLADMPSLTEVCQKEKPLLVVVEVLAGGPTLTSITKMRHDPTTSHIPVLAYTSHPDADIFEQATQAGVTLLAGTASISEHLPRLLEQVLQVE